MPRLRLLAAAVVLAVCTLAAPAAQTPVEYRLSFPEREHRLMQVEITFSDVGPGPLQLRMSRTSPGRYAVHDFAKNVFDVRVTDAAGRALPVSRPSPHAWDVTEHAGEVRVAYRVFGDQVDGTYLAVDTTHAHINMPAALMWARGFELRPATVRFERPPGSSWRVATQLMPGRDALSFSAPNLQYLMDSPSEFSAFTLRTFTVDDNGRTPVFRLAVHHTGTEADVDAFARDVETLVREARYVFGEYPAFEGNTYTFIADYLPWAQGDAMEHRNSTILTSWRTIRANRSDLLVTVAHEFFHAWNVERIRPRSLEPFDFEEASVPGELWLAEGLTNYYARLLARRAGLMTSAEFARRMGTAVNTVLTSPGRQFRSAVEMGQMAAFVDSAASADPTNFENTHVSYYTWGEALGLALDLTLRERSDGRITLDDFMRAMWIRFGRTAARAAGYVETPYTNDDARAVLAEVSGDPAFASEFFARYIEGREVADYAARLARAGMVLRPVNPGRAHLGSFPLEDGPRGPRVSGAVPIGSPAYAAGIDRDDVIMTIAGTKIARASDVDRSIAARKPGELVTVTFERRGELVTATVKLAEDPRREVVLVEDSGGALTEAQRRFREQWLSSPARNAF